MYQLFSEYRDSTLMSAKLLQTIQLIYRSWLKADFMSIGAETLRSTVCIQAWKCCDTSWQFFSFPWWWHHHYTHRCQNAGINNNWMVRERTNDLLSTMTIDLSYVLFLLSNCKLRTQVFKEMQQSHDCRILLWHNIFFFLYQWLPNWICIWIIMFMYHTITLSHFRWIYLFWPVQQSLSSDWCEYYLSSREI